MINQLIQLIAFILLINFSVTRTQAQVLNFYYGNLHAHSSYSDGNKDSATTGYYKPIQNFGYAKTAQHFDFLGISEHNHFGAGMLRQSYALGLSQADSANRDSFFVALYGMEWGVIGPPGGHVLIYGVNQLWGWDTVLGMPNYDVLVNKLDYNELFTKIARTPNTFACLAHPASTDYANIFTSGFNATYDSAIVATAIRSGPAFSTDTLYADPSTSSFEARYKDLLKQGYHVGATLDHDNHYLTFGKMAASRTVVLAPSLTRASIFEAYKKRRTQASDDWNVKVNFTINNKPIGTIFTDTANPHLVVSVYDPDFENTSSISIIYGIPGSGVAPTTLTSSATGSLNFTHSIAYGATYYYYAVITQQDGDKVFTSPIWVTKATSLPIKLLSFYTKEINNSIHCNWVTAAAVNADYFELQRSVDGYYFYTINKQKVINNNIPTHYSYIDEQPLVKQVFYRLKQVDFDGKYTYSNISTLTNNRQTFNITVSPNPFEEKLTVTFDDLPSELIQFSIYDQYGRMVWCKKEGQITQNTTTLNLEDLKGEGMYVLQVADGQRMFWQKIIKQR